MSREKVTVEERIEAAKACAEGRMSRAEAARRLAVDRAQINEWIARYKSQGALAFRKQEHNTAYSDELKAMAVREYLTGAGSLREIAAKYGLRSNRQLRNWIKVYKRIETRLRQAHLRGCPQELSSCVDSPRREYRPHGVTEALASLDFIDDGLNVCILGPSDSGKSYLAKAIGIAACNTCRVEYAHCENLLEELVALKHTDYAKYQRRVKKLCGAALLILDDFLLHTLTDEREVKVLFEILEKRCEGPQPKSTIICSQRDPGSWTSMIMNDEVSANAILKRATKNYTVVIKPQTTD